MKFIFAVIPFIFSLSVSAETANIERQNWKEKRSSDQVVIRNLIGDVRVRTSMIENEFEFVTIEQHNEAKGTLKVVTEQRDNTMHVDVVRVDDKDQVMALQMNDAARIDLTVFVPIGHHITIETNSGLIGAKGLKDPLVATSQSGKIYLLENKNSLNATNGSGEIEVNIPPAAKWQDQTFRTRTGNIHVIMGERQAVDYTIETSGLITTDFSLDIVKNFSAEPNKKATGQINQGGRKLQLSSLQGNVRLLSFQEKSQ
jgi:hypothetical protein